MGWGIAWVPILEGRRFKVIDEIRARNIDVKPEDVEKDTAEESPRYVGTSERPGARTGAGGTWRDEQAAPRALPGPADPLA